MVNEGVNIGVPFGEARDIHIEALYDIRKRISSVIESAGMTHTTVDYDVIQSLVDAAISLLPDITQANKCRELMERYEGEELERITAKNNHAIPTVDDRQQAKRKAAFATLNVIQVIYDNDVGIRRRFTVGVA